jgi:hypothetical protein
MERQGTRKKNTDTTHHPHHRSGSSPFPFLKKNNTNASSSYTTTPQEWVIDLFGGVRTTGQPPHFTYPVEAFDAPRYVRCAILTTTKMM